MAPRRPSAHYATTIAGEGPRATPTISRGRVYALGATGLLNGLDLETGRPIWRRNIGDENEAASPTWGRSGSPLVVDDLMMVSAGGRRVGRWWPTTGKPEGRSGAAATTRQLQLADACDAWRRRQIVVLNQSSVAGHDPATGRVLWNHPWPREPPTVAIPLVLSENRVLLSAGYGLGSRVLQISREGDAVSQTLVWESTRLKAKFTNPVLYDGFVYGLDDGVLVCLDPSNGERRWKGGRYGHGQTILVGNRLLVQTEDGDIVLVDRVPTRIERLPASWRSRRRHGTLRPSPGASYSSVPTPRRRVTSWRGSDAGSGLKAQGSGKPSTTCSKIFLSLEP